MAGDKVTVQNFDEVKLHLKNELFVLAQNIKNTIGGIQLPKSFKIEDLKQLKGISDQLNTLNALNNKLNDIEAAIKAIEINPNITVKAPIIPEIKLPDIKLPKIEFPKIPEPKVNVNPIIDIDISGIIKALKPLLLLSDESTKPLSVRLSDGKKFVEQLGALVKEQKKFASLYIPGHPGITKDEYKRAQGELNQSNTATNDSATMGAASAQIVAAKTTRISLTLVNDSDSVIYISKSATAVLNKGIRLNEYGGSVSFSDYTGVVSGISSDANKNLTYIEV